MYSLAVYLRSPCCLTLYLYCTLFPFQLLVLIVVGVGLLFSIVFHVGVREKPARSATTDNEKSLGESSALNTIEKSTLNKLKMSWKCWLKEHQFYQVSRLFLI